MFLFGFTAACSGHVRAQSEPPGESPAVQTPLTPYRPTRAEVAERYRRAASLDSTARNTVFKTSVQPHWQADGKRFWYRNDVRDSAVEYVYVDAVNGTRRPAFDAGRLAAAVGKASGKTVDAKRMSITAMAFEGTDTLTFQLNGQWWQCNLSTYECGPAVGPDDKAPKSGGSGFKPYNRWELHRTKGDSLSPDGQWVASLKEYNVYLRPANGGNEVQFTTDGTREQPYGAFLWSPDSRYFIGYRISPKEHKEVYYVLSSVDNTTRGQLKSHRYAQPGDEFTGYEMFVFPVGGNQPRKVATERYDFLGMPYPRWRKDDNRYFTFEKADRGHQRFRIIEVDAATGDTRNVVDEKTNTFIYEQRIFTHYLPNTNEIVWATEKDGWRQLYLVDALKATVRPVTKGEWVVRGVDSVDEAKREIWFSASGMNPDEDPYDIHHYRIGFDGKKLVRLNPAPGNHRVVFSPDRNWFIDTYSQPHVPPVTELRRAADGGLVTVLEKADVSAYLATGIPLPEVFRAKGRDGKTDIWGVVCRPRNFDANKRYPVIENIYAGPHDAFVPKNFMAYGEMQSLAELGFVVVQVDGMGTANRSKAFHDVCWKNLADAGFPDRILWMKALARKYPHVDTTRVGLYGTSAGGQNALGALLFHPKFYKAAVSSCGCHDNRIDKQWWNEQWMGYPVGKHYDEQSNVTNAHRLQGDLLLIVGEADTNVPPESTYRVADALIKAGKTFDFLPIPGLGHSDGGPYGRKKKRDFFVRSFFGVEPPNRNTNELGTD